MFTNYTNYLQMLYAYDGGIEQRGAQPSKMQLSQGKQSFKLTLN
jgi:hypothetical protein